MRTTEDKLDRAASPVEHEASEAFIQRAHGDWSVADQEKLQARLATDPLYANAFQGLEKSWRSLGAHAESPELMRLRESAIAWIRRENVKRWRVASRGRRRILAACAGIAALALAAAFQFSPYGYHRNLYSTGIGQQTSLELADSSRVDLDGATRLQVQFTDTARTVRLLEGQAQFSVAKDPRRPFRVQAGDRTIVAIGTVFTVEYVDRKVHVVTLEGKVSVSIVPDKLRDPSGGVPVSAGEGLRIAANGTTVVIPNADLAAAAAWRDGNVIFRDEPLGDAIQRLNRYSHLQLRIVDPSLAKLRISGVFEKADSGAFARSVEAYYPVTADYSDTDSISLRLR